MKLLEFLTVYMFATITGKYKLTFKDISDKYQSCLFYIPIIYCNDGFNLSIQIHNGAYCRSENGFREFGLEWQEVEWGYPSEPLIDEKYNPEEETGTSVGGNVPIEVMEELIEQHGGINIRETLIKYLSNE